jgi:hypothetical protein
MTIRILRYAQNDARPALFPIAGRLADLPRIFRPDLGRVLILALNGFVHFPPMYRNLAGRFDSQPNFVAAHVDDGYDDVVAYDDALVALAGKDKHDTSSGFKVAASEVNSAGRLNRLHPIKPLLS